MIPEDIWWEMELLLFPICTRGHWFLFVIDVGKGEFYTMDSYIDTTDLNSDAQEEIFNYMSKAYKTKFGKKMINKKVKVHQQDNEWDCGLYTAGNVEAILQSGVQQFKEDISSNNWIDKSASKCETKT